MNISDIKELIICASSNRVLEITVDKISIKFKNIDDVQELIIDNGIPAPILKVPDLLDTPENYIESNDQITEEDDMLMKAEELDLMMIEDPARFEEMLATEDSLIDEFQREVEDK